MYGAPPPPVELRQGMCFRYALPAGWSVVEDGPFAVVLVDGARRAVVALVGNAGLPLGYPPHQYVYERLQGIGPEGLQLGSPRAAPPLDGFASAWAFDLAYAVQGAPCLGVACCHLAPAYDSVVMAVTWAASDAPRWAWHAAWLPALTAHFAATNAGAFGARGVMAQNLTNAAAFGQQLQAHRDASHAMWAEVAQQRDASVAQQHDAFRQALGGVERYDNPVTGRAVELSNRYAAYWVHPVSGEIVGGADASFDPRTPHDVAWQRLRRAGRG
ncbi:MAG: hypothetical protein U0325_25375 [Polyangiales bacterium]